MARKTGKKKGNDKKGRTPRLALAVVEKEGRATLVLKKRSRKGDTVLAKRLTRRDARDLIRLLAKHI